MKQLLLPFFSVLLFIHSAEGAPDPAARTAAREKAARIAAENLYVLQMRGFCPDQAEKSIRFDSVVSFDARNRKQVYRENF